MKFEALDSWRGIAALLVVLVHLSANGAFYQFPIVRHGGVAVPLFFVLSGFVITHAYGDRLASFADMKTFVIRRFGRLYPLHLVMLLTLLALELLKLTMVKAGVGSGQAPFTGTNDLKSLVASFFLLQAVIPLGYDSWNGPSWSISTEFYTYLLFAATMVAAGVRARTAVVAIFAVSGVILLAVDLGLVELPRMEGEGLLLCVCGFFGGSIVYRLYRMARDWGARSGTAAELAATSIAIGLFWFEPSGSIGTILGFSLVIFAFAFEGGVVSTVLRTRPLAFLGRISYSIYLVHFVVLSLLGGVVRSLHSILRVPLYNSEGLMDFGPAGSMDALALAYVVVVLVVATLTYHFIEVPGRDLFNEVSRGRSFRAAAAAAFGRRSEQLAN